MWMLKVVFFYSLNRDFIYNNYVNVFNSYWRYSRLILSIGKK